MKCTVYSKDMQISKETSERIEEKLAFLDKYLLIDQQSAKAQVIAKKHGDDVKLEITIPSKIGTLRSEIVSHSLNDAVDLSLEKLENQIRKQKTRLSRRHKDKLAKSFVEVIEEEPVEEKVIKTKRIVVDEMDIDEAIMQMELMDHDFFAFKDSASKVNCIVYRRKDGGYGILEIV